MENSKEYLFIYCKNVNVNLMHPFLIIIIKICIENVVKVKTLKAK